MAGRHVLALVIAVTCCKPRSDPPESVARTPARIDIATLRTADAAAPVRPYEVFLQPHGTATALLGEGWSFRGRPALRLRAPVDWQEFPDGDRSWNFALNAWRPLNTLIASHSDTGDAASFAAALELAEHWIESNPHTRAPEPSGELLWSDMTVARRAYRLAYLFDVARRDPAIADDRVARLWVALIEHLDYLGRDENFTAETNHGFFQAVCQLAAASRLGWLHEAAAWRRQAEERLRVIADSHFTAGGVHKEHSPGYHFRMLENWWAITDEPPLLQSAWAAERIRAYEDALAWMVTPDGTLAMLGDTQRRPVRTATSYIGSPALRFALTGTAGRAPTDSVRAFRDGGLVVLRSGWTEGNKSAYLAQQCAFHSRAHKHADDLTFIWYDHGRHILVGTGSYGYIGKTKPDSALHRRGFWYSDAKRIFVESTAAHNTVEIDGDSYDRVGREPFGSAVEYAGASAGVQFTQCRVTHESVTHTRLLLTSPHRWLVVLDVLDDPTGEHDYRQWFHFAPTLTLGLSGEAVSAKGLPTPLTVVSLVPGPAWRTPVKGQQSPRLQGWWSPEGGTLEAAFAAALEQRGRRVVFATLLSFAAEITPAADNRVSDASARLGWADPNTEHRLDVALGDHEPVITYQAAPHTR